MANCTTHHTFRRLLHFAVVLGLCCISILLSLLSGRSAVQARPAQTTPTPDGTTVSAYPRLPAVTLCAKTGNVLNCIDGRRVPRLTTPENEPVDDFAIAPDGEWVAYRTNSTIKIRGIFREAEQVIDGNAALPSDFRLDHKTLIWSPLGNALAYVVEDGLRIAYPQTEQQTASLTATQALYTDLRFAPDGLRLAAQTDDDSWHIFTIRVAGAQDQGRENTDTALILSSNLPHGELAWVDNQSVVFAAERNGITRLDVTQNPPPALWTTPNGRYIKLQARPATKDVVAYALGEKDGFGSLVSVDVDGAIQPLGAIALDTRIQWILDGQLMVYLTSGTAILVRPESGLENTIDPVRGVRALDFGSLPLSEQRDLTLDADLYYIARDEERVAQVWRILRGGGDPVTVTTANRDIQAYAVSPNKARLAMISGNQLTLEPLPLVMTGFATATPNRFGPTPTTTPLPPVIGANLTGNRFALAWNNTGTLIAYADATGGYVAGVEGLPAPVSVLPAGDYRQVAFSPDSRYLYGLSINSAGKQEIAVATLTPDAPGLDLSTIQSPVQGADIEIGDALFGGRGLIVSVRRGEEWELDLWPFSQESGATVSPTTIARTAWRIEALREGQSGNAILYLQRRNWYAAPDMLTLWSQPLIGDRAAGSTPFNLSSAQLSPTGRFVLGGVNLSADASIGLAARDSMVLFDTQTGAKVILAGVRDSYGFQWIF